jgi:hypothetical protein
MIAYLIYSGCTLQILIDRWVLYQLLDYMMQIAYREQLTFLSVVFDSVYQIRYIVNCLEKIVK